MSRRTRHLLTVRGGASGTLVLDPRHPRLQEQNREALRALDRAPLHRRAVVLVHGFANSRDRAGRSFDDFVQRLQDVLTPYPATQFAEIIEFHWPGDHRLPGVNQLSFSARIEAARHAGEMLGELLQSIPRREIILVAHSLGNAVVLTTLQRMATAGDAAGGRVSNVYLLAPAVPVRECMEPLGAYMDRYPGARASVFYSRRDLVLGLAFPGGQGMFDRLAEAVGRNGMPETDRWDSRTDTHLGHSGYWRSDRIAAAVAHAVSPWGQHYLPAQPMDVEAIADVRWELLTRKLDARTAP
jgi:hypothetical protein